MRRCDHCGHCRAYRLADGRFKCKTCGSRYTWKTVWDSIRLGESTRRRLLVLFVLGVPVYRQRFRAPSGDPFDNSKGFLFPPPEGATKFPKDDPNVTHLLIAQLHIPPTELVEVAGFTGTAGTIGSEFDQFDDGKGGVDPLLATTIELSAREFNANKQ